MYREMKKPLKDWTLGELQGLCKEMEQIEIPIHFTVWHFRHESTTIDLVAGNLNCAQRAVYLKEPLEVEDMVLKIGAKASAVAGAMAVEIENANESNKKRLLALPSPLKTEPTIGSIEEQLT